MLEESFGVKERRACRVVGHPRSTQRLEVNLPSDDEQELRRWLVAFAKEHPRWGRGAHQHRRREGHRVNKKRVQRLWRLEGLKVPYRKRKKPLRGLGVHVGAMSPIRPNAVWTMDFQFDETRDGKQLKLLNIADIFTRECLTITVERSITADDLTKVLDELVAERGAPAYLPCEFGLALAPSLIEPVPGREMTLGGRIPRMLSERLDFHWSITVATNPGNSQSVEARFPSWFGGNDFIDASTDAGVHPSLIDAPTKRWAIETVENHFSSPPNLVVHTPLKRNGVTDNWDFLDSLLEERPQFSLSTEDLAREVQRIQELPAHGYTSIIDATITAVSLVPLQDLKSAVTEAYETLIAIVDADGSHVFPELSISHVSFSPFLIRRATWARALLRVEEEPTLLTTKPTSVGNELLFGTGIHLSSDLLITRDAYLAPLFLCLSPWTWCFKCPRTSGVIIFDFGRQIIGRGSNASELLHTFLPPGPPQSGPAPQISQSSTANTLKWWVRQTDLLLATVTDFANFGDRSGVYEPRRHVEALLTVEQLGRRIQGIFAHNRDISTQRALSFEALDVLEGLGVVKFIQACTLSHAESTLKDLESNLPADVCDLLLPRAREAIDALRDIPKGFFMSSDNTGCGMELPSKEGVSHDRNVLRRGRRSLPSSRKKWASRIHTFCQVRDKAAPNFVERSHWRSRSRHRVPAVPLLALYFGPSRIASLLIIQRSRVPTQEDVRRSRTNNQMMKPPRAAEKF